MMGTLFLLTWGHIIKKFKILDGIFQLGYHQAQVLQANQAGRGSTQLASPGISVLSLEVSKNKVPIMLEIKFYII